MYREEDYRLGSHRSCIRELFEYGNTRAAIVGRENVLDFSIGNPSVPPPPQIAQTIREILSDTDPMQIHGYTSAAGDYDTRAAIARDLNQRFQTALRPENFFLSCGAAPALTAVLHALTFPQAEFLAIAPYFPEYRVFVESAGGRFLAVPPDIPDFQIDLAAVEKMLTPHTAAVLLNSPNNPSGVVYTKDTLAALAEILWRKAAAFGHPIYLISDEPYRELAYGVEVPFVPTLYENTLVCYSYSKSLSLPGERMGYICVPDAVTDSERIYAAVAGAARALGHICAPSLWQKVLARCVGLRPDLRIYDRNRLALYQGLTALGYETAKPDGAFYLFVKAPGGDANAFSRRAMQKDLLVVPGDDFGCPGYLRLCYCISYETIQKSLPVFAELIAAT